MAGVGMALGIGNQSLLAGMAAAVFALFGVLAAKVMIFGFVVHARLPEITSYDSKSLVPIFTASMFGYLDLLFVALAIGSAYKFASKPIELD